MPGHWLPWGLAQLPRVEEEGPGPPCTEPLVIWGRRSVDLTSCLNLALVKFFNRGYDPPSAFSQAFLTYPSNQFVTWALILFFTLELWAWPREEQ